MLLRDKRVVIVEDKYVYVAVASAYLRLEGATVEVVTRPYDVPQLLLTYLPIDVILMDLVLAHNISGFDVADQIRQIPELTQVKMVALTAVDPDLALPLARKKGFNGFIGKPFSALIARQVANVLAGEQVWASENWQAGIME